MDNLFKIPSRIDTVNAHQVASAFQPLIETHKYVILDFSECTYISSMGIRVLLTAKKQLLKRQGELFLCHVCPSIRGVLDTSGMSTLFALRKEVSQAQQEIEALKQTVSLDTDFVFEGRGFRYTELNAPISARLWDVAENEEATLCGLNELQFSIGKGSPADGIAYDCSDFQPFVSTGTCVAFPRSADFRIAQDPAQSGVYLSGAFSFGTTPTGSFKSHQPVHISLSQALETASYLCRTQYSQANGPVLCVFICTEGNEPQVHLALIRSLSGTTSTMEGASLLLGEWRSSTNDLHLSTLLQTQLTFDNITDVQALQAQCSLLNPTCYLFVALQTVDAQQDRMAIRMADGEPPLELYKTFLARRIYTDSARIQIKKLHGGFSAQTFQVASFDADGRKLRPTVMKVASKDMIERESSRCLQYAQPYILNNSAQVLGTEFFEDMGALRYNFVGIGGDESELKWLTLHFQQDSFLELDPLFDKIFLKILHPWYGQAVIKTLHPFEDHDPTLTFFPHLYNTSASVLGINADDEFLFLNELNRRIRNPYWYLKHIYPKRRNECFDYYTGICHGDLNMQNILIDDNNNVFLIDFSETRPRAAISDFARLEAIFLLDNAPLQEQDVLESEDYLSYARKLVQLYGSFHTLDTAVPDDCKTFQLTGKMRRYALSCAHNDTNSIPYCFALLEWILPIICYVGMPLMTKRLSFVVSALLMEQLEQKMPYLK